MSLPERRRQPRPGPFESAVVLGRRKRDAESLAAFARPFVAGHIGQLAGLDPAASAARPDEVLAAIASQRPELVIRASAPRAPDGGIELDGLDTALIRRCSSPVWFTDPATDVLPHRVLAAINPIVEERVDQAGAVLDVARRLADGIDADLHVLHVWIAFGDTLLRPRMRQEEVDAYVQSQRDGAVRRVEWSLGRAGIRLPAARLHLLQGHFGQLLPDVTRHERIDLVVMGTRGRHGPAAAALVSPYPEVVLRKCAGPLLIVK